MDFLDKMERKFGKFAIRNLMLYILMGNGIIFLLDALTNGMASYYTCFNWDMVLQGQIWRLVTFVFIPQSDSIIFFIFIAFLYYSIGSALEHAWGTFRFNVYYISGALLTVISLIIVSTVFGIRNYWGTAYYINLSLFLAYACLFPDVEFLVYMILPIKVKYLAFLDVALLAVNFITGNTVSRVLILVSLLNFIVFFGKQLRGGGHSTTTQRNFNKQKQDNKKRELKQGDPIRVAFHKCTICGKTELTDPDMEFRYCSKCNGNYEYCMDHLRDHEHK